jgi:hypothetical protein
MNGVETKCIYHFLFVVLVIRNTELSSIHSLSLFCANTVNTEGWNIGKFISGNEVQVVNSLNW